MKRFVVTTLERLQVLGCATVKPLGQNEAGDELAELAAFCIHPAFRGGGKGDSLLEYLGNSCGGCLTYRTSCM